MKSFNDNEVWELIELPEGRKAVGSKWVYKVKIDANGSIERYKARLVAQGFLQKYGTDYDETFCPVVRLESFRTIVALAVHSGCLRTGTPISEHDFSCNFSHHISRTLHVMNKKVAP